MTSEPLLGGIEAGGTKIVCALGTGPGDLRDRVSIHTGAPEATLDTIAAFFTDHASRGDAITALGVASFGPLDLDPDSPTFGSVTTTPKPGWAGTDLRGGLAARLQVPVTLDTDVNGAAWGEHLWGATRGLASSAYVTVGTGIGGGAIVHGRRLHGLMHPEMGHLHVQRHPDDDFEGTCPFHGGCLEGLASGPAINGRTGTPAQHLSPQARAAAVEVEAWYLAQLVTAVIYLLSPQRVVVGGGVLHLDGLLDAVRDATTARLADAISGSVMQGGMGAYLVRPQLGHYAGVLGALALALDALPADPRQAAVPPPDAQ